MSQWRCSSGISRASTWTNQPRCRESHDDARICPTCSSKAITASSKSSTKSGFTSTNLSSAKDCFVLQIDITRCPHATSCRARTKPTKPIYSGSFRSGKNFLSSSMSASVGAPFRFLKRSANPSRPHIKLSGEEHLTTCLCLCK